MILASYYKIVETGVAMENTANKYRIELLEKRKKFHDVSWLHKLLNSSIIRPELSRQIPIRL